MNRVLFVCTGNTCRSPMAEAILKSKRIPSIEVKSAGVYATKGQDASTYVLEILHDHQITHHHSSTPLSEEELEWATHVFTMTEGHKSIITDSFPRTLDKIFTLKEFVYNDPNDRDIMDPFGGSQETYRETFNELQSLIDELIHKLDE